MTLNQIITYTLSIFLVSSVVSNYVLFSQLDKKKQELILCSASVKNLEISIDKQNKAFNDLKAQTQNIQKDFDEVSKKYQYYKNNKHVLDLKIKELEKQGYNKQSAECLANKEIVKDALDDFFKK